MVSNSSCVCVCIDRLVLRGRMGFRILHKIPCGCFYMDLRLEWCPRCILDELEAMVLSRIFESGLYLTSVLYSSSYATYIRKFKGRESHSVVALRLNLH